ncbi:MAG: hypothetical protein MK078_07725 [Crocinitomicaceae bacterium]|nr:hypothetical protein [Crocinitomicaceae bacterium]
MESTIRTNFLRTLPNELEYYGEKDDFFKKCPIKVFDLLPSDILESSKEDEVYFWTKERL